MCVHTMNRGGLKRKKGSPHLIEDNLIVLLHKEGAESYTIMLATQGAGPSSPTLYHSEQLERGDSLAPKIQ